MPGVASRSIGRVACSAAQAQPADQLLVPRSVLALQVVQQRTTLADHDQEAAAAMEILLVVAQMAGQILDPFGQDRDLHFRRTGVAFLGGVFFDELVLALSGNRHRKRSLIYRFRTRTGRSMPASNSANAMSLPLAETETIDPLPS